MINLSLHATKAVAGQAAAQFGAHAIRSAIRSNGHAKIVLATGASQFDMLAALVEQPDIDWTFVSVFHLDEYVGLPQTHPASFRRYLKERFLSQIPGVAAFHAIGADATDISAEIARLNANIPDTEIDVVFAGIGENGHLAFNDPPANFDVSDAFHLVDLDKRCQQQQLGEGWFPTISDVPRRAISMTVRRMLDSRLLVLCVPDARKAEALRNALEGVVTNLCSASIVRTHPDCRIFLDPAAASLLTRGIDGSPLYIASSAVS